MYGKRYRPIACKQSQPTDTTFILPSTSTSVTSALGSLSLARSQNVATPIQHVLLLNNEERKKFERSTKIKTVGNSQEVSSNKIFVSNVPTNVSSEVSGYKPMEGCNNGSENNQMQAVNILDYNAALQNAIRCESVEGIPDDLELGNMSDISIEDLLKETGVDQDITEDINSILDSNVQPFSDDNLFVIKDGEHAEPSSSDVNRTKSVSRFDSVDEESVLKMISGPKNVSNLSSLPDVAAVDGVDPIDNFKESDVDSLCSTQFFSESMNTCSACGEVFLMKSSLLQHCRTYHGEKFD